MTVYQRTPIWVTPKTDFRIPRLLQRLFAVQPWTQRLARRANSAWLEGMMVTAVLHYRQARFFNQAAARLSKRHLRQAGRRPRAAREADARLQLRLQAADVLQRLLPDVHPARTSPWRRRRSRGSRRPGSSRRTATETPDRHPRAGDRLQPLGRELPGDRGDRPRGSQPRQVVARAGLPGLRGRLGAAVPQLHHPELAVQLLRALVLHDHRGADAPPRAALRITRRAAARAPSRSASAPTTSSSPGCSRGWTTPCSTSARAPPRAATTTPTRATR